MRKNNSTAKQTLVLLLNQHRIKKANSRKIKRVKTKRKIRTAKRKKRIKKIRKTAEKKRIIRKTGKKKMKVKKTKPLIRTNNSSRTRSSSNPNNRGAGMRR